MTFIKKKTLNIAISNRDPKLWPGGDVVVQQNYTSYLKELGNRVKSYSSYYFDPKSLDIVLSFNINFFWVFTHLLNAKRHNKHFVVFCQNCNVNRPDFQKFIVKYADALLFYSQVERKALEEYLKIMIPDSKCFFLEQGVESAYISSQTKDKKGVLCVGRVEKRKNQLMLIKACGQLNIPLKIAGFIADQEYYEQCIQESKKYATDISFLPYISQDELRKLYMVSKVVANIALFEPWGLTVREGGLSNCNALMTNNTYVKRNIPHFWWCLSTSLSSVKKNLKEAYEAPNTLTLQHYLIKSYMWEDQTRQLLDVLEDVYSKKVLMIPSAGWKEGVEICIREIQFNQNVLLSKDKTIDELFRSDKEKQKAIEELIASNIVKQHFIERVRHIPMYSLIKQMFKTESSGD